MLKCQRCGSDGVSFTGGNAKFICGIEARLCSDCMTAVNGIVLVSSEWMAIVEAEADIQWMKLRVTAGNSPSNDQVRMAYRQRLHAERALRPVILAALRPRKETEAE